MSKFDPKRGWFHWNHGFFFQRQDDGSVTIAKYPLFPDNSVLEWEYTMPENEWASIVASVSKNGETGESWRQARAFHNGGCVPATP